MLFLTFILILDLKSIREDGGNSSSSSPSCKRPRRAVRFEEPEAHVVPKPKLSLILTQYALKHAVNRPILLKRNRDQMEELMNTLRVQKN